MVAAYKPLLETPDLSGKVALVAGGNAGIGFETVKHLALHGAKVYLLARSQERGQAAIETLREGGAFEKGHVELLLCDLSLLKDVKRAAEEVLSKETRLDILVNNAAILPFYDSKYTDEGLEYSLVTNYLSQFLLTMTLLPLSKHAAAEPGTDVRIVNVSSIAYISAPPFDKVSDIKDLDRVRGNGKNDTMKRYAVTKLCQIWFTGELQQRLDAEGVDILVMSVDPGTVITPGAKDSLYQLPLPIAHLVWYIASPFFPGPAKGAYPVMYAATSTKVRQDAAKHKAACITRPNKLTPLTGQALNGELAAQTWQVSEQAVQMVLGKGAIGA